jgi:glycerol-3-phosphate O-acyltransferase
VIRTTLRFILHNLWLMTRSRWQRFGYACVNFGAPLSARAYCQAHNVDFSRLNQEARFAAVEALARELMSHVEHLIPVLPVALVARAVLEVPEGESEFDLKARVYRLIDTLRAQGAVVMVPTHNRARTVDNAFNMLKLRRLLVESEGRYRSDPNSLDVLAYYANSIAHWRG